MDSNVGVVVRKEAVIVQADVFNSRAAIGVLLVAAAPASVADRAWLLDDFLDNLWLLIVVEQVTDALRQHHAARHTRCRFQGSAQKPLPNAGAGAAAAG